MPPGFPVVWLGVYTAHELPTYETCLKACRQYSHLRANQDFGVAFVVNTDTKDKGGEHWVAFYLPSPYHPAISHGAYFFDPLGRSPAENGHDDWVVYLSNWSTDKWEDNSIYIQQVGTNCCGQLCLLWLFYKLGRQPFPFGCGTPVSVIKKHYDNMAYMHGLMGKQRSNIYLRTPLLNFQTQDV